MALFDTLYKYGTLVSAISIFIALWKMILHRALAPSAIHGLSKNICTIVFFVAFKNLCVIVPWMKVALALEGLILNTFQDLFTKKR